MIALFLLAQHLAVAPPSSAGGALPEWADYDADGRVDLELLDATGRLRLFRNEGDAFRDVTAEAGLARLEDLRLARFADFDRDGRPDLLVVSTAGMPSLLRSTGGTFESVDLLPARARDVVGAAWLDPDGDGWPDLWLTRPGGALLLANERGRSFRTIELALPDPVTATMPALRKEATEPAASADPAQETETAPHHAEDVAPRLAPSSTPRRIPVPSPEALPAGTGSVVPIQLGPSCAQTIRDRATGDCLSASSTPILGTLYPLSAALNVDAIGRVGVGTIAPTHQLTVNAPNDDALRLIGAGAFGSQARLNFGDGDFVYAFEDVDDSLEIHANGRTALTGGNVGIGTSSPAWPLHVVGAQGVGRFDSTGSTFGSVIELRNQTVGPTYLGALNFVNSAGSFRGQIGYLGADALAFNVAGAERMRIDASGRLGIGTTAPTWPLHVVGNQGVGRFDSTSSALGSAIELRNTTASPSLLGAINFVNAAASIRGQIACSAFDALTFSAGGAERMRIDASSGSIGIGTSSPGRALQVVGSAPFEPVLQVENTGADDGIWAFAGGSLARAVLGVYTGSSNGKGVQGQTTSASGYGVFAAGNFGGTGAKYFVQPHPTDASKEIRFVCLEGNESGTYFRGSTELVGGRAVIDVPEEFRLVTESEGLTVQLTPRGDARLWVEEEGLERIVVRGSADVSFHYLVNGVRRGFAGLECVRDNDAWVPEERGVPYGTQYPEALRRVLVENGILNDDFTPNEATAARLGWKLRDPAGSSSRPGEPR